MKNIKNMFSQKTFKIIKWILLFIIGAFLLLVVVRFFHYFDVKKTNNQVLKIHSTKISMMDVMGNNLPVDPGIVADKTIQGVDSNNNGIRDDIEIAIFKEYPNSAKTRAVLLQYALALQMENIQPFLNDSIVTEIVTEQGRANTCLSDSLVPRKSFDSPRDSFEMEKINKYISFIEEQQLNTQDRKEARVIFYKYLRSYGESTNNICDIDLSKLSN